MPTADPDVLRLADTDADAVTALLASFGLRLIPCPPGTSIPGSFWGEEEAGLRGDRLYARDDTPLHSILHEAGHYICADPRRRDGLDTDAGSDDAEECAVCYLQVLLAEAITGFGRARMLADMDRWGYSFRLGSSAAWFEQDASDARAWLHRNGLIDVAGRLDYRLREEA